MSDNPDADSRANRNIDFAEGLLKDMSEGKLVDPRTAEQRRFDAIFYLMKGILFELERIGDQLEHAGKGKYGDPGVR
jgi:hypothetical protein